MGTYVLWCLHVYYPAFSFKTFLLGKGESNVERSQTEITRSSA
jgi:hypothetical protein